MRNPACRAVGRAREGPGDAEGDQDPKKQMGGQEKGKLVRHPIKKAKECVNPKKRQGFQPGCAGDLPAADQPNPAHQQSQGVKLEGQEHQISQQAFQKEARGQREQLLEEDRADHRAEHLGQREDPQHAGQLDQEGGEPDHKRQPHPGELQRSQCEDRPGIPPDQAVDQDGREGQEGQHVVRGAQAQHDCACEKGRVVPGLFETFVQRQAGEQEEGEQGVYLGGHSVEPESVGDSNAESGQEGRRERAGISEAEPEEQGEGAGAEGCRERVDQPGGMERREKPHQGVPKHDVKRVVPGSHAQPGKRQRIAAEPVGGQIGEDEGLSGERFDLQLGAVPPGQGGLQGIEIKTQRKKKHKGGEERGQPRAYPVKNPGQRSPFDDSWRLAVPHSFNRCVCR